MANLISKATGNWTAGTTWNTAQTSGAQTTKSSSTNTTTSYVYNGVAFTVTSGTTIDGILMFAKNGGTSGTVSVAFSDDNGVTATREVTFNNTDLPTDQSWVFIKFGTTYTPPGVDETDCKIGIKGSSNATGTFYRSGTAADWARLIRLDGDGAPAASDAIYVVGEITGAGSVNTLTVTMDETAATAYGKVDIGHAGVATAGTSASTTYTTTTAGITEVWYGGTLSLGTTGTPVPATSTFNYIFSVATNVDSGLDVKNGGTFNMQGASKTMKAKLAANAAAGATSLTTDVSTGWKNGDSIALASTTRTYTEAETKALTADASGTTLTVAALTNAHLGTSPTVADVINLSPYVQIRGTSAALQAYCIFQAGATVDCDYGSFKWMGSGTAQKRGIDALTTSSGSVNIQNCVLRNFEVANSRGLFISASNSDNVTFSNNVLWTIAANGVYVNATSAGTNIFIEDNVVIYVTGGVGCTSLDGGITFDGNTVASCSSNGIALSEAAKMTGTFANLTAYSCATNGLDLSSFEGATISNVTAWRNNTYNIACSGGNNITLDTGTSFGGATSNIIFDVDSTGYLIKSYTVDAGATLASPSAIRIAAGVLLLDTRFEGCTFGNTTAHSTADIELRSGTDYDQLFFNNCKFASSTEISGQTSIAPNCFLNSMKHDQTAGDNRSYGRYGTIQTDTTIYRTASPSVRMTPNTATYKLSSPRSRVWTVNVNSGQTCTPTVYVRESVVGDGTDYNGARIRLIVLANPSIGITADTVVATATASSEGAWEALTGTVAAASADGVMRFMIDCDGTTGWVNVDDFSVTLA